MQEQGMHCVVVGGTAAGLSAAAKLRRLKPDARITVYERSGYVSYGACGLPYFVADWIKDAEDLISLDAQNLKDQRGITALTQHSVLAIDRAKQRLRVRNDRSGEIFEEGYDKLVLATGAKAIVPPLPGIDGPSVYPLKTVEDGIALKAAASEGKSAVILGAGMIGLEVAEALAERGMQVHLVEMQERLLPFYEERFGEEASAVLKEAGVHLHLGKAMDAVLREEARLVGVRLAGGETLEASLLVLAVGVLPETELAKEAGLALGFRGGILVDKQQRTSDPNIFAAGDCALSFHRMQEEAVHLPLGTHANKQGRVAGAVLGGEADHFAGVLGSQAIKLFDRFFAATGLSLQQALDQGHEAFASCIQKGERASYYPGGVSSTLCLIVEKKTGRILGAQGSGSEAVAGRINALAIAIVKAMCVEELRQMDLVYTPSLAPVYDPILIAAAKAEKEV